MANVVLKNISKQFGDVVAVNDVNLEIADREFVVLVGPSGCGKTTTLRMIAGLEEISEGEIIIGDRVVNQLTPMERNIAMVFQSYALYPHMKVFDNMAFGLKMRKVSKEQREEQVKKAAEILGIEDLLNRKPKQLSGGQRQRVALGRAIVRDPDVFLFDEPLSNLDAKLRVQMRIELKKLHERLKATVVYVTHDQVEAMTMGDRIVVMKDGIVQQVGNPLELFNKPANRFVAGFIGSPAMNMFAEKLERRNGDPVFNEGSFTVLLRGLEEVGGFPEGVVLGIRPEHLSVEAVDAPAQPGELEVEVEVVEPLGSELYVHGRAGRCSLVARVEPDQAVDVGARVRLRLDLKRVHFFDSDSGVALRPSAAGVS